MKRIPLLFAILTSFIARIFVLACKPASGSSPIVVGENAYICITFNDKIRLPFLVEIDKMTSIGLGGSYTSDEQFTFEGNGQWSVFDISASGGEDSVSKSSRKIYKYPGLNGNRVMNVYTAIIHVNMGVVTGISWDDGCFFCSLTTCDSSTALITGTNSTITGYEQLDASRTELVDLFGENCYTPVSGSGNCEQICTSGKACECDLSVYVVWTGTDVNGKYMKSAGLRFSRFESFSLNTLYASAKTRTTDYLTKQGLA